MSTPKVVHQALKHSKRIHKHKWIISFDDAVCSSPKCKAYGVLRNGNIEIRTAP